MSEILLNGAAQLGVELAAAQQQAFGLYLDLLLQGNRVVNLTSLREPDAVERRHLLESLAFGALLAGRGLLTAGVRILDLGSGGGLPGIPLKLAWPEVALTLLEATARKARFLEGAIAALGLPRAAVLYGRAEALAHDPNLRGQFDLVSARAVAALPALVELALPFLTLGGTLAAVKGSRAPAELTAAHEALRVCGGRVVATEPLPAEGPLHLILIEKISETPLTYPRRPGRPAAAPLGLGLGAGR
ncbi:MAG TPA: 16S rRNA (guanine(527)-N(7))-methyltransferase RsmG [Steroidobacteraceae bacterium]|nr:16S rRNA (guanine(527)-N(7))-methyltransferase RsmG [Steroidobacteraceae bacterium]